MGAVIGEGGNGVDCEHVDVGRRVHDVGRGEVARPDSHRVAVGADVLLLFVGFGGEFVVVLGAIRDGVAVCGWTDCCEGDEKGDSVVEVVG